MAPYHIGRKNGKLTNGAAPGCINDVIFWIAQFFLGGLRIICKRFNFNCMGVNQRKQKPTREKEQRKR